jgi:hypothetical protein
MGIYRLRSSYSSIDEYYVPSTRTVSFINKAPQVISVIFATISFFFLSIAMPIIMVEVSVLLGLILLIGLCLLPGLMLLIWRLKSYTLQGSEYNGKVLPVEEAYAKMPKARRKQYKKFVEQAYRNAVKYKSNAEIKELFEAFAAEEQMEDYSQEIRNELEIARDYKDAMRKAGL